MALQSQFLGLPRELRDLIYIHYVQEPDGLHYNFKSGKLRTAAGKPPDLALMYTCTSVAAEMSGLALQNNTIVFSTGFPEPDGGNARRFHNILSHWKHLRTIIAREAGTLTARGEGQTEVEDPNALRILEEVLLKYPQFKRFARDGRIPSEDFWATGLGEGCSLYDSFLIDLIKSLHTTTDLVERCSRTFQAEIDREGEEQLLWFGVPGEVPIRSTIQPHEEKSALSYIHSSYLTSPPLCWSIPTDEEILKMSEIAASHLEWEGSRYEEFEANRSRPLRYSAAAAAIRFLSSLSEISRRMIRTIVIDEDRRAAANPKCHAIGLIQFCQENPELCIRRKVNMWRTVLNTFHDHEKELSDPRHPFIPDLNSEYCLIKTSDLVREFRGWLLEVRALFIAGMPLSSFSLEFDGQPILEQASEAFKVIKEDAAIRVAQEQLVAEKLVNLTAGQTSLIRANYGEGYHEMVSDMIAGTSRISCNFPLGGALDVHEVLNKYCERLCTGWRGITSIWQDRASNLFWRVRPPLPDWSDVRLELFKRA